jgi:hypothetical protein
LEATGARSGAVRVREAASEACIVVIVVRASVCGARIVWGDYDSSSFYEK